MKLELLVAISTWAYYFGIEHGHYQASWRVHAFAIIVPILILKCTPDLDLRARLFIMTILAWHVMDVLTRAIDDGLKNDSEYQVCTSIASTSSDDKIAEDASPKSSSVKISDPLSSSPRPTEESKPQKESISVRPNTDAPRVM
jgi:hypothetical protein